ncbi:hypothetical protein ANME2D_02109 [Candidatus Methanoperedens nitroreducens]|uniref:Uncharacterized protein n=1 Tax=Candidatus Methanoperedens nitratireducens TaxID=1392998 RepID=A0A062V202_9EURY|nr:hypothetical protein [Candidatus Methanoperedens nitroreducens]KCZ71382.1 hypothetical protein ANME2D_02109 [Candidatus Methanoperedens nitroreducens]MDJ1421009.1 hypothetical protein [Candidatus Methanoperedens sp.]
MSQVISKDGTSIAYDKTDKGLAVILVDGTMCYRQHWEDEAGAMPERNAFADRMNNIPKFAISKTLEELE